MSPQSFRRAARGLCAALVLTTPACAHDWSSNPDSEQEKDAATSDDGGDAEDSGETEDVSEDGAKPNPDVADSAADAALDAQTTATDAGMDAATGDSGYIDAGSAADAEADANSTVDAQVDAGPPCYADNDKDGVGTGAPVSCEGYGTDAGAALSLLNTDCDDNNNKRSPSLTDVCGDKIDNDCDGAPDDESNNACGGACTTQLAHQPNESCDNGLLGACKRAGKYVCQGTTATACNAPAVSKGTEVCGDSVDNDCDGNVDEDDAIDARTWYRDCDNDGYATTASTKACNKPAPTSTCTNWLTAEPTVGSTADCDDYSASYRPTGGPGYPVAPNPSFDLDCDLTTKFHNIVYWPMEGSILSNVAYVCSPGLSCSACWTEVCAGNDSFFGCLGARFVNERRCGTSYNDRQTVRLATSGCTDWASTSMAAVEQMCR